MSCGKSRGVVVVPIVVEPVPIEVDLAIVPVDVWDVQVATLVQHKTYGAPSMPPPLEYSQGCIVFGIIMP